MASEMSEQGFGELVQAALEAAGDHDDGEILDGQEVDVRTFRDAGLLTHDHGLVVRVGKAEFQLTIKRAR